MLRKIRVMHKNNFRFALRVSLSILIWSGLVRAAENQERTDHYFKIQVVDRQTGRGVPLVQLRTTNNIRYYTDSNGIVAFYEPGLMNREVFFFVESHGYEFPKDGFGMRGTRLKTAPGGTAVIKIDRLNIAERLYRVTGQGIYRDSLLTGHQVPLKNPVLNGQVMGQDSVFTCLYHGRLFWMWGDTAKPSYPLGNFAMSGAVSDLPGRGGLEPSVGVNLEYFVGEDGFSRPMSPMNEPGLVWLDGLLTVRDPKGNERMIAKFARLKGLSEVLERGLMVFNDDTETFEPLMRGDLEFLPYRNTGHAFGVEVEGDSYYYFTSPSPMGVRLRVRARWDYVIDPNRYEALTSLRTINEGRGTRDEAQWIPFGELVTSRNATKAKVIETLEQEAKGVKVYDIESGKTILPHNGTVYFNAFRKRWIGIFVQQFGEPSNLGEVWYAEADTPVGPWAYARKIVTHNKYSFYNPKQHPFFDEGDGRVIYFEGTYSHTFSGSAETATPRYDYNQIMYRLNLDDSRLVLPVAVYQVKSEPVGGANSVLPTRNYVLADGVREADKWDSVASVPFYAVEPQRASRDLVPIYVQTTGAGSRLTTERPNPSADVLFYVLSPDASTGEEKKAPDPFSALYEYRHTDSGRYLYSTEPQLQEEGWIRTDKALCRVWKTPPGPLLLDGKAKPGAGI